MRKFLILGILILMAGLTACNRGGGTNDPINPQIQVAFHDVPYPTEENLRIGYTLKTWEYEQDGLDLQEIQVLNAATGQELYRIGKAELPRIYKSPLASPYFTVDTLTNYYISIQLPIPLTDTPPSTVFHRLVFRNVNDGSTTVAEGGAFSPRLNESPVAIAPPLKGENINFINLSTNGYHFYIMLFVNGELYRSERFAFDTMEVSSDLQQADNGGNPNLNSSYFNYGKPLYAVADGVVVHLQDGRPENNGSAHDAVLSSADEYGGNYLVLDIGNGRYAFYCHCIPNSFTVSLGDRVKEGDQVARLGNSGNSDAPHLHFHIADSPNLWYSKGLPFVFKRFTRTGTYVYPGPGTPSTPETFTNRAMENNAVVTLE